MTATARELVVTAEPLLVKRQTTSNAIEMGESTVIEFERMGWLTPIRIPGLRVVWHDWAEVKRLAERIKRGESSTERGQ